MIVGKLLPLRGLNDGKPKSLAVLVLLLVGFGLFGVFMLWAGWHFRQTIRSNRRAADFPITVARAQPLIEAINRYHADHRMQPLDLIRLVPRYIPELPDPGPAAKDGWHYKLEPHMSYEVGAGWELSIRVRDKYSPNFAGFGDHLVYNPTGKYEQSDYGGILLPFGNPDWGYYVE